MKLKPWTIALLLLIVLDSIVTTYIGTESNMLIMWTMKTFDLTLKQAMIARIFYCLPLVIALNYTDFSKITVFLYIGLYIVLSGVGLS